MTSVLIVDDHPIVLQGCRRILEDARIGPVTDARDLVAGYRAYLRAKPDVAIVDLSLQNDGLAGLTLIRRIRRHDPRARVLVLSMHADPMIVLRALEAGASGYILKDTSSEDMVAAIEHVMAGKPYISGNLATEVALARANARRDPLAELTPRELQTLSLLARGKPYGDIAGDLAVSYKTVVNHASALKQKLNARTLPELISIAVKLLAERG